MKSLENKKVKKGAGDKFSVVFDTEEVSALGIITEIPEDLTGWKFNMYVHKHVEYCEEQEIFKTPGIVPDPKKGEVVFFTVGCKNDIKPGVYWYTVEYIKPNGRHKMTNSAKYEVVESLNEYFSIYDNNRD